MIELIVFKAKASTPEELEMVRQALNGLFGDNDMSPEEIQRLKKSERNKKDYQNRKLKNAECAENAESAKEKREEEREEKEAVSPLVPPSLSPDTPYPIPPIIPPSQEKEEREGERKESFVAATAANTGEAVIPEQPLPFGNFVRLKNSEYDKLVAKFGVVRVDEMIQRMDNYIGEDPKRQKKYETRNHYLTLLNWERMDQERKTQPLMQKPQPEQPRRKSWAELGREMDAKERGEVIDL